MWENFIALSLDDTFEESLNLFDSGQESPTTLIPSLSVNLPDRLMNKLLQVQAECVILSADGASPTTVTSIEEM